VKVAPTSIVGATFTVALFKNTVALRFLILNF
jgi:hypothetical protein